MPKNLVLCLDGTHNQISGANTNVWRLFAALERSERQVAFYLPGVGTLFDPSAATGLRRWTLMGLDLATAYTLGTNFGQAYRFLVDHYEEGDAVYLLGFSRSAYTARAVAGAAHQFGLLGRDDAHLVPHLWQTYSDGRAGDMWVTSDRFKHALTNGRPVPVRFLGVWDTVSAFGVVARLRTLPFTRGNPSVACVRQAAALDERRSLYLLNRFEHGVTGQDLRQVWFAGYHSDVGGVFDPEAASLGRLSLAWMAREAVGRGLLLRPDAAQEVLAAPEDSALAPSHDSMDPLFALAEFLPTRAWNAARERFAFRRPNLFRPRAVPKGALVHASVKKRMEDAGVRYRPPRPFVEPTWVDGS